MSAEQVEDLFGKLDENGVGSFSEDIPVNVKTPGTPGPAKRPAAKKPAAKKVAPPKVNVQVGPKTAGHSSKDADFQVVRDRAKSMSQFVCMGLVMIGQDADARPISDHSDAWSDAVAGLAEYEPWLVKLCQGGEVSGRVTAWAQVSAITLAMLYPIACNHNAVPEVTRKMLDKIMTTAGA